MPTALEGTNAAGGGGDDDEAAKPPAASSPLPPLPPILLVLTVSPGKLGLTLSVLPNGEGAKIVAIDPACTFKGQVEVGDRIVTIDNKRVEKLEDLTVGKEKMRKFGIAKEAQIIANKKAVAEAKAAAEAKICSREECPNQANTGGVCRRHGAKVKICSREECPNQAYTGGVCRRHGAKVKICSREGCPNQVKARGVCRRHGVDQPSPNVMAGASSNEQPPANRDDAGWDDQYKALCAYRQQFDNCNVPTRSKSEPKLGRWVMTQRRQFTLRTQGLPSMLTAERIRKLEDIGFTWSVRPGPAKDCESAGKVAMTHADQPPNPQGGSSKGVAMTPKKKICSHEGCTNLAKAREVCARHGAKPNCSREGCVNLAMARGVCGRHGAKPNCSREGCPNKVQKGGVCWRHGANHKPKPNCSREGCVNKVEQGGVCRRHGAKVKICSREGCPNQVKARGVCIRHGANHKPNTPAATPNRPMKNKTAYKLYLCANRKEVKAANPAAKVADITKILSTNFGALTPEERAPWDVKAAADKVRYQKEMEEYSAKEKEDNAENMNQMIGLLSTLANASSHDAADTPSHATAGAADKVNTVSPETVPLQTPTSTLPMEDLDLFNNCGDDNFEPLSDFSFGETEEVEDEPQAKRQKTSGEDESEGSRPPPTSYPTQEHHATQQQHPAQYPPLHPTQHLPSHPMQQYHTQQQHPPPAQHPHLYSTQQPQTYPLQHIGFPTPSNPTQHPSSHQHSTQTEQLEPELVAAGWQSGKDPNYQGSTYYYRRSTGESVWVKPIIERLSHAEDAANNNANKAGNNRSLHPVQPQPNRIQQIQQTVQGLLASLPAMEQQKMDTSATRDTISRLQDRLYEEIVSSFLQPQQP